MCESIADWLDSDGGEICITELKQRSGYGGNLLPSSYQSRIAKDHADMLNNGFHRHLDVFTAEPVNQWIEITARSIICFNPIWFTEYRVYELGINTFKKLSKPCLKVLSLIKMPILIVDRGNQFDGVDRHHCKVQIGNESKTLVKFHSMMSMCPHAPQFGINPYTSKDRMLHNL